MRVKKFLARSEDPMDAAKSMLGSLVSNDDAQVVSDAAAKVKVDGDSA